MATMLLSPPAFDLPRLPAAPSQQHDLVKPAIVLSLLVHALLIGVLPGMQPLRTAPPLQVSFRLPALLQTNADDTQEATNTVASRHLPETRRSHQPDSVLPHPAPAAAVSTITSAAATSTATHASPAANLAAAPVGETRPPVPASIAPTSVASHAPAPQDHSLDRYGRAFADQLSQQQKYPRLAAMRGWEGEVRVQVRIARKGNIIAVALDRSSGFAVLDQQALQLVQAAVAPPLPDNLDGNEVQLIVPIHFRLNKQG